MFRSYQQLEHSDCGIACIRMVARFYGKKIASEQVRDSCDMSRMGVSIADIVGAFKGLGMESVAVKLSPEECARMPLPAVIYWQQKHFVVLYKIKGGRYYVADPAAGKMRFAEKDFMENWLCGGERGVAILAEPGEEFESRRFTPPMTLRRFGAMFRKSMLENRRTFLGVILLTALCMAGDIASPLIFQHTVDEGINGKDVGLVWILVLSQLMVFLGNYVSQSAVQYIMARFGLRMGIRMMNEYLSKLVSLPMLFFARKVNSDLIQKTADQGRIKDFLVSMPDTIFFTLLSLVVFSGLLIYFSPFIFLVFTCLTACGFAWTALFMRRRREMDYASNAANAENVNNLYEIVHGMQEIKTNNAREVRVEKWREVQRRLNRVSIRAVRLSMWINGGNSLFMRLKDIAVTGICATMVINDAMTIGQMMTISYIVGRLAVPFNSLLSSVSTVQDACMSFARVEEVLGHEQEDTASKLHEVPQEDIRLERVFFKYPGSGSPYVLRDLNIVIPRGKTTAIVGASGCGKTTLIKIILGMFAPARGRVAVGSADLADIAEDAWLRDIGVVMQSGRLFSGSILENIALADASPDRERARRAAETACLLDFIETLPMGFDTRLGVAGVELSGGQLQRLLIARAIYKNPSIVILDEATSSLDAGNEARIVRGLEELFRGKTVIIAAHRLSTVCRADNIIFMADGSVGEQGSHEKLVKNRSGYYSLVKNQLELGS